MTLRLRPGGRLAMALMAFALVRLCRFTAVGHADPYPPITPADSRSAASITTDPWCGSPSPPTVSRRRLRPQSLPSPLPRIAIVGSDGTARLQILGTSGQRVNLETADSLTASSWRSIGLIDLGPAAVDWPLATPDDGTAFFRLSTRDEGPRPAEDFGLLDVQGRYRHLGYSMGDASLAGFLLVFTGVGIPPSDARLRDLPRLAEQLRPKGIVLWVVADPGTGDRTNLADQAVAAGLAPSGVPVLCDPALVVTRHYRISSTPAAVLVGRETGEVLYQGPLGSHLPAALATLQGGPRATVIEAAVTDGHDLPPAPPTPDYASEVAPVLRRKCVLCHSPGYAAPWSMTNYAVVVEHAAAIQSAILEGHMPPWGGDPAFGRFSNDRSLSAEELSVLVRWLDAGAPAGTGPDLLAASPPAPAPKWPVDLGEPDLVLHLPAQSIKARGNEPYRYGDLTLPLDRTNWLRAVLLRPSNQRVTHHLVAYRKRGPGPGYPEIAGYAPGYEAQRFPAGTGRRLDPHGVLTLEMHYTPTGAPEVDTPELALWFHASPPARELILSDVSNERLRIAAHDSNSVQSIELELDRTLTVYDFIPHMHLRGTSMKYEALFPGGRTEVLLSVPHYDFHWQNTYTLAEPRVLPAGTRIRLTATYDNSWLNPLNPNPDGVVWWGEQSSQEMMIGFFNMTRN